MNRIETGPVVPLVSPFTMSIALEIEKQRVRAVWAKPEGRTLRVRRVVIEDVLGDLDRDDPAAFGRWLGERLRAHGIPKHRRVTVALAREFVGLKRLVLPSIDPDELPEMVRLALHRDLPFDSAQAVIDFVPVEQGESSTTVLAVAVPDTLRIWMRAAMRAAGLRLERMTLRAMGIASLLRTQGEADLGTAFAVEHTRDGAEYCIVNGAIRFSRAAEIGGSTEPTPRADALVTETRRTWMSFRVAEGDMPVRRAVLIGDRAVMTLARAPIESMLQVPCEVLAGHPLIDGGEESLDRVWPLAGLLLEPLLGGPTIDFLRPRKRVDPRDVRRRRVLMAAGGVLVVAMALWTVGRRDLQNLEHRLDTLSKTRSGLASTYARYHRDAARLTHLEHWEGVSVDWLAHLEHLVEQLPASDEAVLDGWTASLDFRGVAYDRRAKTWSAPHSMTFVVDGEARSRTVADLIRDRLVSESWLDATSTGAEATGGRRLPDGFTLRLETTRGAPPTPAEERKASRDPAPEPEAEARPDEGGAP